MADNKFQSIFTVEFEDFNIVKSKLDNLQKKISSSNSSGIKLDVDIGNINKILEDVTKLSKTNIQILPSGQVKVINTLNDELGKTIKLTEDLSSGKVKIDLGNNFEKQAKAEAKEQEKIAKERINLAKQLAKEEQQQRMESQSLAKQQLEDYTNMEKAINQNKLNSARKEAEENNRILQENYLAEQKLAEQMAKGRESTELKKQQAIKKSEEAQTKAMNKALENSKKEEANAKIEEQNAKKLIEYEKEKLKLKQKGIELNRGTLVNSTKSGEIGNSIENLSGNTASEVRANVQKLNLELQKLDQSARLKGVEVGQHNVSSLGDAFKSTLSKLGIFASTTMIIREFSNQLRQATQYTIEMDTALTNIMMITGQSASSVGKITDEFKALGDQLHTTNREIMRSSEDILRAGYDTETSKKMVEASVIGSKLSGQTSKEVTEQLIAIKNAFDMTGDEMTSVIDLMAQMDRTSATSFGELSQAVMRTAFSAKEMGTSFDDLLAYVTTVSEKTRRSADTIGESFKSIYSRYSNVKLGNLDDDGKSINDVEKALGRLDIKIRDGADSFRDFDDVLKEFMDKVKSGSVSEVDKMAAVNALAGTRQKETLLALIENTDALAKHQEDLASSTGMAKEMFDSAYSDSLDAKINDLNRSFEGLYESILNSSTLKFGLDISADTINGLSKFIDTFGIMPTMTTTVVGGLTLFNSKFRESTSFISKFALETTGLQPKINNLNTTLQKKAKILNTDIQITKGMIDANQKAGEGTATLSRKLTMYEAQLTATNIKIGLLKVGTIALQSVMTMGLSIAVTGMISLFAKAVDSMILTKKELKELNEEFSSTFSTQSGNISNAEQLVKTYKNIEGELKTLTEGTDTYKTKEEELANVQQQIIDLYPQSAEAISGNTDSKKANLDITEKLIEKDKELLKADSRDILDKNKMTNGDDILKLTNDWKTAYEDMAKYNKMLDDEITTVTTEIVDTQTGAIFETTTSVNDMLQSAKKRYEEYGTTLETVRSAISVLAEDNDEYKNVLKAIDDVMVKNTENLKANTQAKEENANAGESTPYDPQANLVAATQEYSKASAEAQKLKGYIDDINKAGAVTPEIVSKLTSEYNDIGMSVFDTASAIDFLNGKMQEQVDSQVNAMQIMQDNDAQFYQNKIANNQAFTDFFNQTLQSMVGMDLQSANIQLNQFTTLQQLKEALLNQFGQSTANAIGLALSLYNQGYNQDLSMYGSLQAAKDGK